MHDRPLAKEIATTLPGLDPFLQSLTPCDDGALRRLTMAFNEAQPAAILIGDGNARSGRVIDNFLTDIDDTTSVIRITTPCTDATSCFRAVVGSVGFESKDFGLADLQKIFTMFLRHQKTHGLRTVLCIENAQDCDLWVIDKLSELTDMEAQEKFGLFVIISGHRELKEMRQQMPLQRIAARAGREILVAPLQLSETRKFVLQQIETENSEQANEVIQFEAITRLHEIGGGVADTVSGLCTKSMQLAEQGSCYPITEDTISQAALELGLGSDKSLQVAPEFEKPEAQSRSFGRLAFTLGGDAFGEFALNSDCVSIGRDRNNSVCIPSRLVSRHHVLIVTSRKGVKIMDLGSTNRTLVNGARINSCILRNGDNIRIGDCEIEYCAGPAGSQVSASAI